MLFTEYFTYENPHYPISMDDKGHCMDNIFIEHLWRLVKYEKILPEEFETFPELLSGL